PRVQDSRSTVLRKDGTKRRDAELQRGQLLCSQRWRSDRSYQPSHRVGAMSGDATERLAIRDHQPHIDDGRPPAGRSGGTADGFVMARSKASVTARNNTKI